MTEPVILLVEDNSSDEQLTLRALRKNNILNKVVVVRDGAEALNHLFPSGESGPAAIDLPHVVLLDLNLPKIGGLEVLRRIRAHENTKLLPVVILTSSKQDNDLLAGYTGGANSYVVKPIDFNQFADSVKNLGLYWLVINQRPLI